MSEATFGDVTGEYLALREAAATVRPAHELVWVRGPDAVSFLDGLLSQDIAGMAEGEVARSFLLEPRGKLASLLWVLKGSGEIGLAADSGRGGPLVEALTRFRFRVDATIEAEEKTAEVWGPEAAEVLVGNGFAAPEGWKQTAAGPAAALPLGNLPRFLVSDPVVARLEDHGVRRAGTVAATTVRIEAGEPLMGVDVDGTTIPQETGLVDAAVSFTKGCYLGQELVARIDSRGRVNRHLRGLRLTDNVIPPEGAAVVYGDLDAGVLTSVGESLTLRAPIGLAILRREVEPGSGVEIRWPDGTAAASVEELPLDDFAGA